MGLRIFFGTTQMDEELTVGELQYLADNYPPLEANEKVRIDTMEHKGNKYYLVLAGPDHDAHGVWAEMTGCWVALLITTNAERASQATV